MTSERFGLTKQAEHLVGRQAEADHRLLASGKDVEPGLCRNLDNEDKSHVARWYLVDAERRVAPGDVASRF